MKSRSDDEVDELPLAAIIYIYVGNGLGVPGLPGRVTRKEAETLGALDILEAALANGNFSIEAPANEREQEA